MHILGCRPIPWAHRSDRLQTGRTSAITAVTAVTAVTSVTSVTTTTVTTVTVTATIEHSLESGPGITGDRTRTTAVLESGALMDAVKWRPEDWSGVSRIGVKPDGTGCARS